MWLRLPPLRCRRLWFLLQVAFSDRELEQVWVPLRLVQSRLASPAWLYLAQALASLLRQAVSISRTCQMRSQVKYPKVKQHAQPG
jgi:hypothetical protein